MRRSEFINNFFEMIVLRDDFPSLSFVLLVVGG